MNKETSAGQRLVLDQNAIDKAARSELNEGAVTPSYGPWRDDIVRLLNDALAITSIVVSHDLAETASIADYLYVVGDSQVLGQGTPDELMNSDNPRIRQFMKGIPDGPVPFHFPAPDYRKDLLGDH